jgi:DNA repair protein SbcC/Rad50
VIPVRLRMKNFMCYRENVPTLDFEGIHVACLCGDNGSGKSSIFDAITWALWGEASRGKSNDDLIYSGPGTNEMEVELEFLSGNDRYRVIRKHSRSTTAKSGQSMLDLQSFSHGAFKSLSEHTKTQTQDKIQSLLHLDYQTFINSAMILQGRANEFSNKRPGERKEILANILDLSFYDQLEQQAKASSEAGKFEAANLGRVIEALALKLEEKTQLEQTGLAIDRELQSIESSQKTIDSDILKYREKRESLVARKEQLGLLMQQINSKRNDLQVWQKRLGEAARFVERSNEIMTKSAEIEAGYSEYRNIVSQDEQLNEKLKKSLELVQRKGKLEGLIASAQNIFTNERKILATRVTELTTKFDRLPQFQQQKDRLLVRQAELEQIEAGIDEKRKQFNRLTGELGTLTALNTELFPAIEETRKKIGMLSHAGATCPLCESELGPDGCSRIKNKLTLEMEQKISQSKDNTSKIAAGRTELASLEKEIKQLELSFKSDRDNTKQQLALTEKEILEAENAREELAAKKAALQKLETDIRDKNYAVDERKTLEELEREQRQLSYDPAIHKQVAQKKSSLQNYDGLYRELCEARLQYESQNKARIDSETTMAQLNADIASLTQRHAEIAGQITELPKITEQIADLERGQNALIIEERNIRDRLAASKEKLKQLAQMAVEKQEKERMLIQSKEDESIFAELARCFSKRGIQALIIEETLPDIEYEANLLLGKMTDNRMALRLQTQRDTKKGDTIETLDIWIADELGSRAYDMYSGGEAFRIDLALRIAISRLLVRRVGASMPILIIDEGFGTQDNAGLEKLIEAINAIQDDFEKVFVITHLDELKDRFPVLINVTKTSDGSVVLISQ